MTLDPDMYDEDAADLAFLLVRRLIAPGDLFESELRIVSRLQLGKALTLAVDAAVRGVPHVESRLPGGLLAAWRDAAMEHS